MPDNIFKVVVFPAPFGPMNPTNSFSPTAKEILSSATVCLYFRAKRSEIKFLPLIGDWYIFVKLLTVIIYLNTITADNKFSVVIRQKSVAIDFTVSRPSFDIFLR